MALLQSINKQMQVLPPAEVINHAFFSFSLHRFLVKQHAGSCQLYLTMIQKEFTAWINLTLERLAGFSSSTTLHSLLLRLHHVTQKTIQDTLLSPQSVIFCCNLKYPLHNMTLIRTPLLQTGTTQRHPVKRFVQHLGGQEGVILSETRSAILWRMILWGHWSMTEKLCNGGKGQ